ncbi:MAG: hypothetical protein K2W82_05855 [Candidatus Obscuribacterales bacterium]|nr:hypothetical protein [Candidatus Obscuribacterales bacterium]
MDFNFHTVLWLGVWYLAVAGLIWLFRTVFRLLNQQKWRDDHGDVTHEVGYMEDPIGHVIVNPEHTESVVEEGDISPPHIQSGGNLGSGPM